MGYDMSDLDKDNFNRAWAFLERRLQAQYDEADKSIEKWEQECQECRQKLQSLQQESSLLGNQRKKAELVLQMFRYGGETIEIEEDVAQELAQTAEKMALCRDQLSALEKDAVVAQERGLLESAAFLKQQKNQLLEKGSQENQELAVWDYRGKEDTLQAEYFLLCHSFMSELPCDTSDFLWDYLNRSDIRVLPMDEEKTAFCGVVAAVLLRQALKLYGVGESSEAVKQILQRLEEALADVPAGAPLYPILAQFQMLLRMGSAGIEEISCLGTFYHYSDGVKGNIGQKATGNAWLACFRKGMQDEAYHEVMQKPLKSGFYDFLTVYENNGKKCLYDVLGEWEQQTQFKSYTAAFTKDVERYLDSEAYINEVLDTLKQRASNMPIQEYLEPWDFRRAGQLGHLCALESREQWLHAELSPCCWTDRWLEEKIREMIYDQLRQYARGSQGSGKMALYKADTDNTSKWLDFYFRELTQGQVNDGQLDADIRNWLLPSVMQNLQDKSKRAEFKVMGKYVGTKIFEPYAKILRDNADDIMQKKFSYYVKLLNDSRNSQEEEQVWSAYTREIQSLKAASQNPRSAPPKAVSQKPKRNTITNSISPITKEKKLHYLMLYTGIFMGIHWITFVIGEIVLFFCVKKKADKMCRWVLQTTVVCLLSAVGNYCAGGYSLVNLTFYDVPVLNAMMFWGFGVLYFVAWMRKSSR